MKKMNEQISRNRAFLMGIACLWILFQHIHISTDFYPLWALGRFGISQVDVFLFLSGFGVYYSLERRDDIIGFYKDRAIRILPIYYFFAAIYVLYAFALNGMDPIGALGVLTCTSFWTGGEYVFSWFTHVIVTLYFIAPIVFCCVSRFRHNRGKLLLLLLACILLSVSSVKSSLEMGISRFVSFILGMIIASQKDTEFAKGEKKWRIISCVAAITSVILIAVIELFVDRPELESYRLIFLPLFLLPLGECLILSAVGDRLRDIKAARWIVAGLEKLGVLTFEVYLLQTLINLPIDRYVIANGSTMNIIKISVAVLCIPAAGWMHTYIFRRVQDHLAKKSMAAVNER